MAGAPTQAAERSTLIFHHVNGEAAGPVRDATSWALTSFGDLPSFFPEDVDTSCSVWLWESNFVVEVLGPSSFPYYCPTGANAPSLFVGDVYVGEGVEDDEAFKYRLVKNIFRKIRARPDLDQYTTLFEQYSIRVGEKEKR